MGVKTLWLNFGLFCSFLAKFRFIHFSSRDTLRNLWCLSISSPFPLGFLSGYSQSAFQFISFKLVHRVVAIHFFKINLELMNIESKNHMIAISVINLFLGARNCQSIKNYTSLQKWEAFAIIQNWYAKYVRNLSKMLEPFRIIFIKPIIMVLDL